MSGINTLECMRVFRAVVATGSFTKAAKSLNLSAAWTAKNIERLEHHLGATLFLRSTRSLRLTEAGQTCYASAGRIVEELDDLKNSLDEGTHLQAGTIKVSIPHILAYFGMGQIVGSFTEAYPNIKLDITVTDKFMDLFDESFDFVLRVSETLKDSSLKTRRLGNVPVTLCSAPSYLKKFGTPNNPEELLTHRALVYSTSGTPPLWRFTRNNKEVNIRPNAHMSVNNSPMLKQAILSGTGLAYIPEFIMRSEIRTGKVIRLLPDYQTKTFGLFLLRPADKYQPKRCALFAEHIVENLSNILNAL